MTSETPKLTIDEVRNLSDDEKYQLLARTWDLPSSRIEVWGELRPKPNGEGTVYWLSDIRSVAGNKSLSYPLDVARDIDIGVYFSPFSHAVRLLQGEGSVLIKCDLVFASDTERERQLNPLGLKADGASASRLVSVPTLSEDAPKILTDGLSTYLSESIYQLHAKAATERLDEELALQRNTIAAAELAKAELAKSVQALTSDRDALLHLTQELKASIEAKMFSLDSIHQQCKKAEDDMSLKIERLKNYIREKASFLSTFEFIDDEDFEAFIDQPAKRDSAGMVSFAEELGGDYRSAVSYIQAYLKGKNVLYSRHIIENYLTLVRTNDLIVLAGDSGSGKTHLVQSFAEAIGGVAKIIPVKPNWTSSEDLIGYYNPLEKKYLATPFLEALNEAKRHPDIPYFICLDEMNLARVEFYFADFLSKLEVRDAPPEIQLYPDDESSHVLTELKAVFEVITDAKAKFGQEGIVDFVKLMQNEDINRELKAAFGFGESDSLLKYHADIRRMLAGVMNMQSTVVLPANVRIVGAINIDETTHYLSPKILDRVHVMKFESPLLADWDAIFAEIEAYGLGAVDKPLRIDVQALGARAPYPKFDRGDDFCVLFVDLNKKFFSRLGVEFGMRTIRQGLHYMALFAEVNEDQQRGINNFILHKVLPKFTFDGNKQVGETIKLELIDKVLLARLLSELPDHAAYPSEFSCINAIRELVENARANDGVVNFWA